MINLLYVENSVYRIVPSKRPWAVGAQVPKSEVGGYTEKVLKWSTIPVQGSTPDVKLAARVYCIVASSVLSQGQPDSGESCVMLQS